MNTPKRGFRIADPLYDAAVRAAANRGEDVSTVVRVMLAAYAGISDPAWRSLKGRALAENRDLGDVVASALRAYPRSR